MNKRKIDISQLKKITCKGKKIKTITVRYETVLSYFKQKDTKQLTVFQISFLQLIQDLIMQLNSIQLVQKLEKQSKQTLKILPNITNSLKLQHFDLKALSKQYPIQQLCSCLMIQGQQKKTLTIIKSKLMTFFKYLRSIYPDFCYCSGEKIIVQQTELKLFYELFKSQWNKCQQKGRLNEIQKIQQRICRSLYFLGIIIENNILEAIQFAQRKKREEQSDPGTRSQHKKNNKGVNQQVSTVHSFASFDPSNQSLRLKSQTSQEELFAIRNNHSQYSQYSQKSQKIISKSRQDLLDKIQVHNLKFKVKRQKILEPEIIPKFQINYLSNDVQNILIQQAFKMQKFSDSCDKQDHTISPYQYVLVDYYNYPNQIQQNQQGFYINNYNNYNNYNPYQYVPQTYYPAYPQYLPPSDYHAGDNAELNQLKRSLGCLNLVHTKKKQKRFK